MNDVQCEEQAVRDLRTFARERGCDLAPLCHGWAFLNDGRFLSLWRKEGKLHYSLQGKITVLPHKLAGSAGAFQGMWIERGTFDSMEQAFELARAWLLDGKEVDDLPERRVRSYGI